LALVFASDAKMARKLTADLEKCYPNDSLVMFNCLPTLKAALSLNEPALGMRAVDLLKAATIYEFGAAGTGVFTTWAYPVYSRGTSYLDARRPRLAAAEFPKILELPGVLTTEIIGPLSHLELGRAYAIECDVGKAKSQYVDFFDLWKNADPKTPILVSAKAEFVRIGKSAPKNSCHPEN
jgi:eukaryotic-like serine/threonine-protein kinase